MVQSVAENKVLSFNWSQNTDNKKPSKDANRESANRESANESEDVFGDTFCDMDLADVSMEAVNNARTGVDTTNKNASNSNVGNKSCPKTPGFEVCSEELLLEESADQPAQVSVL